MLSKRTIELVHAQKERRLKTPETAKKKMSIIYLDVYMLLHRARELSARAL